MLLAVLIFGILIPASAAEDRWVTLHSDGFELFTNTTPKAGRAELVRLEQFRFALGKLLGKSDLTIAPPAQVFLFKTAREADRYSAAGPIQTGREHTSLILSADTPPEKFQQSLARLLIEANTDRMPADLERGLISLFGTLEVTGIRITLNKPPRDKDTARVHMLTADPQYYGKLGVLFYNLQKGAEDDPAYRNAFGKSKAEIEAETARYLAGGNFPTATLPSRPMSAEHDYPDKPIETPAIQEKLTVLLHDQDVLAEYKALLASGDTLALRKAIELEPKQAEPRFLLAEREPDLKERVELLKAALALDRRNAAGWQTLAETYAQLHDYPESAKAWRAAEQAASTPAQHEQMQRARLDVDRQRLDYEAAEKKRLAEEEAREIEKLKQAEIANLRAAEARFGPAPPEKKAEKWWTGPAPGGKTQGMLTQVDCLGKQARLIIQTADRKIVKLLVRDSSQIAIVGAKQEDLGCGRQKPRKVSVEYFPKPDPKLSTAGDVATIEFPE